MSEAVKFTHTHEQDSLNGLKWLEKGSKANVIIMEGMEEHCSRYDAFAKHLNEKGFDVYALDTFGQGLNVHENLDNIGMWPENGFIRQVNAVADLVKQLKKDKPTYIFSHSMGSFMGQRFLEVYPGLVDKIVLCGSGSKNPVLGMGHFLARITTSKKNKDNKSKLMNKMMFGSFNKKIKNPRTGYDWLSYNEENVDKYIKDPLCGFGPRKGFCLEFIKGMLPIHKAKSLKQLNPDTKIFIISGEEDPVTNYGKSVAILEKMYHKYGVKSVQTKVYTHMRHEILNELEKEKVFEDISKFFLD
ncbi:MAG: lysophospholipase [Bacilli bacterium]|nr:lysophospholipase [Bacilli bacterium]